LACICDGPYRYRRWKLQFRRVPARRAAAGGPVIAPASLHLSCVKTPLGEAPVVHSPADASRHRVRGERGQPGGVRPPGL